MLTFHTSTDAWEGLNEALLLGPKELGPFYYKSGCIYVYDLVVHIQNPKLDEEFDFGRHFNYSMAKWKSLVSNYVNYEDLDNIKKTVDIEEAKGKSRVYNIALQFNNKHKHGKNCLLSVVFSRRAISSTPTISIFLRASEATKRLACDLLLFQRIGEYVYGDKPFEMVIHFNQLFNDDNVLLMYHSRKNLFKLFKENPVKDEVLSKRVSELKVTLRDLLDKDPMDIKYKIYRRVARSIQPNFKRPKTLAKYCTL